MSETFRSDEHPDAQSAVAGHLYVVATPIGNLADLSPRGQTILRSVDRICAEDTRNTGMLLSHFGISKPLTALHEHNEAGLVSSLIEMLQAGRSLAVVSDAGTPLISDPGFALVRAARAADLPVITVPGPCAAIAALSIAGIPSDAFSFVGFLPSKASQRRERLRELGTQSNTLIVYESSHRIADCLDDLASVLGPTRRVCLARELTKRFEQSVVMPAVELVAWLAADSNRTRGEFVLVIEGAPAAGVGRAEHERLLRVLLKELSPSKAAKLAAELSGGRKSELYALALEINGGDGVAGVE
ncbi:MAG: rsmI [Hydrocarboniphaga sp.]|uniref:16S rRNA (cytidine(1402)-2'-O)-methyltransferase n=1 Tax=Hydrocarboniphaga sp. TaxID=2033016 RepID=UPI0026388D2E|nr:16S rRNA (cytidine(1402)-2'-O)-methyltransferase [Hydrocarboniphaga sp.]MDB5969576.1 rsmI [Hydrocarboniphaga sp.]